MYKKEPPYIKKMKARLDYNPRTGQFVHLIKSGSRTKGQVAGSITDSGYIVIGVCGKNYRAHLLAWFYTYGEWPSLDIDHINGNRADNRIKNLRVVTRKENSRNSSLRSNNTSGQVGVSYMQRLGKWRAYITENGKQIGLGLYSSVELATEARKKAEKKYGYHSNHGKQAS